MAHPPPWRRKTRYHHLDLRASALVRGREIVAARGPLALTLRGLARDLGVTAPALVYHFGSIQGLREAVAESAVDALAARAGLQHDAPTRPVREKVADWVTLAAAHPGLYRLASGETWHAPTRCAGGWHGFGMIPSPRRFLETELGRLNVREPRTAASLVHGLALAHIDGVSASVVARELERAFAR